MTMRVTFVCAIVILGLLLAPARLGAAGQSLLFATADSQAIQNERANAYHLSRMASREMIQRFFRAGYLVAVPLRTPTYYLYEVPLPYRYLRPWTKLFLDRLSREFHARFGQRLRVTSLIRTVGWQRRLEGDNPNAADATGPDASSHLTGATLDISRRFMSLAGQEWMQRVLLGLERAGYLYAIEEFEEPCFHVMVYPTYREYVARLTARSAPHEERAAAAGPSGPGRRGR